MLLWCYWNCKKNLDSSILEHHQLRTTVLVHLKSCLLNNRFVFFEERSMLCIELLLARIYSLCDGAFSRCTSRGKQVLWPSLNRRSRWFCYPDWWGRRHCSLAGRLFTMQAQSAKERLPSRQKSLPRSCYSSLRFTIYKEHHLLICLTHLKYPSKLPQKIKFQNPSKKLKITKE